MNIVDLECIKSEYSVECGDSTIPGGQLLHLGQCNGDCFKTGLFFHLPPLGCSRQIKQARLFLFKISQDACCCCCKSKENEYFAYPLLEFFGTICDAGNPQFDKDLHVKFRNEVCASYTEIDITKLVQAWTFGQIDNKGILLRGRRRNLITYASTRYWDPGMRPFVRISYEEDRRLVSVPCEVTVP